MEAIILNGPMGVGKTTIGKAIAERYEGTAFIDGDWLMDLHPFVGNSETRNMALDNILHLASNYLKCSVCKRIVIVWLMDDPDVFERLKKGLKDLGLQAFSYTLICSEDQLCRQWKDDKSCEWRTNDLLDVSIRSLPHFLMMEDRFDISGLSIDEAADKILKEVTGA